MTRAVVAAAVLAMACGGTDAGREPSQTSGRWTLQQDRVVCEGADRTERLADGSTACTWGCVSMASKLTIAVKTESVTWIIQPDGSGSPTFGPADCG